MKINIHTILQTIQKSKKYFIIVFLLTFLASTVIAFMLPVIYASTAFFLVISPKSYDPRTKFHDMELYGEPEDVNRTIALAESGEVRDYIIHKYDLAKRYKYDTNDAYDASNLRLEYYGNLLAKETNKGAVSITFHDKSADTAALIVNDIIGHINTINKTVIKEAINNQFLTYKKLMLEKYSGLDSLNEILAYIKTQDKNSPSHEVNSMELFDTYSRLQESDANLKSIQDDIETIQVIEKAVPIRKKEKPKRMFIVALACISTFLITLLFLLVKDKKNFEEEIA